MTNTVRFMSDEGVDCGSLTTSSTVIKLDANTLLLDGGVRINVSFEIGMIHDEKHSISYINSKYAHKNYEKNEHITKFLIELFNKYNNRK